MKISEHGKQRPHTLYIEDKSLKLKISIYTYWKLAEAGNSNSYRTLHGSTDQHCTTLFFRKTKVISQRNLASRSLIIGTWELFLASSRLDPCILKLELFKLWDMRIESRVLSFKCQLTFVGTLDWDDLPRPLPVRQVNYYLKLLSHWESLLVLLLYRTFSSPVSKSMGPLLTQKGCSLQFGQAILLNIKLYQKWES